MLERGLKRSKQPIQIQHVLIVAHGAAIHALLTALADEHMGIQDTRLVNACLNYVEWTDGEWKVS